MRALLFGLIWLCQGGAIQAAENITLFTYQQQPPYVVNFQAQQGLYFDLAQRLEELLPAYHFSVREMPRRRLDRQLASGQLQGLVLGVSATWFASSAQYSFSQAFIDDGNRLVSRAAGEASQLTLGTLAGHRLGLVAGHQYPELGEWLLAGTVSREDSVSENVNLERLQRGWVDATVLGERTLAYFFKQQPGLRAQLFVAEPVLSRYRRHLLVPAAYARLLPELNRVIDVLASDPLWQTKLAGYR
ncbi:polar amino acid transport system substrate-binding protein [Pseudomonas sp. TE3786]